MPLPHANCFNPRAQTEASLIERLFRRNDARKRHMNAPLLQEREEYLMSLMHQGSIQKRVRQVAGALLRVIQVMDISSLRLVEPSEIEAAGERWLADPTASLRKPAGEISVREFRREAMNWFRFHQILAPKTDVPKPYGDILSRYRIYVNLTLFPSTARLYFRWASLFLTMTEAFQPNLLQLSTVDIDRFLDSKRSAGYKPRSVASVCVALRYFLRFTENHGWTTSKLSMAIKSPRVRRYDSQTRGPRWSDVRKLLDGCGHGRADIRARAIISLFAIYALRASEVANLNLSDLNWTDETITIRRGKSRMVQRFPLQCEVGEAILAYLRRCRPQCSSKLLFVTLSPPYRRVCVASIGDIIRDRMRRLKIKAPSMGAHSLRHSCATELLRKGVPLAAIADFLGHQDLSSISVYAKPSAQSLRDVASASLAGLL